MRTYLVELENSDGSLDCLIATTHNEDQQAIMEALSLFKTANTGSTRLVVRRDNITIFEVSFGSDLRRQMDFRIMARSRQRDMNDERSQFRQDEISHRPAQ